MEKRNNLFYFESYDEIRSHMAQGFPQCVYLVTHYCAILQGELVMRPKNRKPSDTYGHRVSKKQIDEGCVDDWHLSPDQVVMGNLEDYPCTDYAVRHNFRRTSIEADTPLAGLYEAGDILSALLRTDGDRRTVFTAQELLKPKAKGGVELVWPEDAQDLLYTVTTPTGRYQVSADNLLGMIDRMEKVEGVGPAKRRQFTVMPKEQQGRKLMARMTFEADKTLPKMKKCWGEDEVLRPKLLYPVIELQTGVMVASDGHKLAAHKTRGYKSEVTVEPRYDLLFLPREVTQMKGTVSIVVETTDDGELLITASDNSGRTATVEQHEHYPNWRSVIPRQVGKAIAVDAPAWEKGVKQLLPQLNGAYGLMYMDAEQGSKTICFSGEDYDFNKAASTTVPATGGVNGGLYVGVKATSLQTMMQFGVTKMHYTDPTRALLFRNDETVLICMPMLVDQPKDRPRGPEKTETFNLEKWIEAEVQATKAAKPKAKKKAMKPKPAKPKQAAKVSGTNNSQVVTKQSASCYQTTDTVTLEERLREALRNQMTEYQKAA